METKWKNRKFSASGLDEKQQTVGVIILKQGDFPSVCDAFLTNCTCLKTSDLHPHVTPNGTFEGVEQTLIQDTTKMVNKKTGL